MKSKMLQIALAVVVVLAFGYALAAWAATAGTGTGGGSDPTNIACATATVPAHTLTDSQVGATVSGTSTSVCNTQSYTIPTSTTTVTTTPTSSTSSTSTSSTSSTTSTTSGGGGPGACTVGPPGSTWTVGSNGYNRVGWDTFTKAQASGPAWSNGNDTTPVYTGDQGMPWVTYPDGWGANGVTPAYQPSTVLSVHDGVLDFYLHSELGASPSPWPGGTAASQYQTYGAYSMCEKVAPDSGSSLRDFKQAILLWPQADSNGPAAESDYPEGNFTDASGNPSTLMSAFAHHDSTQDAFPTGTLDLTQWHVYTQTWGPGFRCYYVDGSSIGCSTTNVFSSPERWQLQVQPLSGSTTGGHGHVYINWVWIGAPSSTSSTSSSTTSTSSSTSSSSTSSTTPTTTTTTTTTSTTPTTTTTTTTPPPGKISHVVVIVDENQDYSNVFGSSSAPNWNKYASQFGYASAYYANGHFSLDNYLTMTGGIIGTGNSDSCGSFSGNNIFNQLGAGNAVNYVESGNTDCDHNPASQWSDLSSSFTQTLPSTPFSSTAFNPAYVFISPNKTDDGHDTNVATADSYIGTIVPAIMATPQYQAGTMAIFLVWDESNVNDTQGTTTPPDNHVLADVISPNTPTGTVVSTQFTHCSLLRTAEDVLGLAPLGCAATANSMMLPFGL